LKTAEEKKPIEVDVSCPVSKEGRVTFMVWLKRLGWVGFLFFLIKGLLWLLIPFLIARGFF
jgi:hypothetical protein